MAAKLQELNIPAGYTTELDVTGDCYACDFCIEKGKGGDSELSCGHPTPAKTGCADHNIVFVRIG